jgi:hypothetical protein
MVETCIIPLVPDGGKSNHHTRTARPVASIGCVSSQALYRLSLFQKSPQQHADET